MAFSPELVQDVYRVRRQKRNWMHTIDDRVKRKYSAVTSSHRALRMTVFMLFLVS